MKKNKTKKFTVGGKVHNFITNPDTTMTKHHINLSRAKLEALDNPFAKVADILGGVAPMVLGAFQGGTNTTTNSTEFTAKTGGTVPGRNIEIERDELIQRPDGSILDFKGIGKKHSEGGIKLDSNIAPEGTDVHSAQVKIGGKSMADIKRAYEKKLSKYDKLVKENPMDRNLLKTKRLFEEGYQRVNDKNMAIQNILNQMTQKKFALGGTINPENYGLSEDEFLEIKQIAEENGISFEEAYEYYMTNPEKQSFEDIEDEEEDEENDEQSIEEEEEEEIIEEPEEEYDDSEEDDEEYGLYATGGTIPPKNRYDIYGENGIAYSSGELNKFLNSNFSPKDPLNFLGYKNYIANDNFNTLLEEFGYDKFDLSDKNHIKSLQQKLGMPKNLQTGYLGTITDKTINDYYKSKPDIYNDKNVFGFINPITKTPTEPVLSREHKDINFIPTTLHPELYNKQSTVSRVLGNLGDKIGGALGSLSAGDIVGMGASLLGSRAGLRNTEANRAGDRPNINYSLGYGDKGLKLIDDAMLGLKANEQDALNRIEISRNNNLNRLRNSARGINTLRALSIANDNSTDSIMSKIKLDYANKVLEMLKYKQGLLDKQDSVVMQGEANRDMNDRRDRDNYYSQRGTDIASMYTGLQHFAKHLNEPVTRKQNQDMISALSKYFGIKMSPKGFEIVNKES